ncbi:MULTISPECIES: hypothetical protein [unclassified Mesorhizobium]|uniref:hypothetical protein n=1 Tax=unclassified Mesorhizobium TaxID=325217 RepID=UPI0019D2246D|nr:MULTISPECIES: hypothetical protein [unclassified Mesorhizobium]
MSMLSKLIDEAGARADSVPRFVIELLEALETRVDNIEKALAPSPDTSAQKAAAPAPSNPPSPAPAAAPAAPAAPAPQA